MTPPVPLLRAPPFPWVAEKVAAVSVAQREPGAEIAPARLEELARAILAGRVGGSFWARPAETVRPIVIRAHSEEAVRGLIEEARAIGGVGDILLCVPDELWARALAGPGTVVGEVDPWSLLGPDSTLLAEPGDEWNWLGLIAGAKVRALGAADLAPGLAASLAGAAYRDCYSGAETTPERAIEILADWRRQIDANRPIAAMTGIAWWKKQAIGRFLWSPRAPILIDAEDAGAAIAAAGPGEAIAVWPSRAPAGLMEAGAPLVRIEDGFIRSVGLGSDLHPPSSIVVDHGGLYYDPGSASDLETILATADFPAALVERSLELRDAIVAGGISKYASSAVPSRPPAPRQKRTVLVTGQVEDDMSVRCGGAGVAGNLDLLRRARAIEADAHIIFKPHPDVDAGHRQGKVADTELLKFADEIVRDEAIVALFARVDAVHVLTSLTGFEALLRGLEVTVHGQPFYAGWGLTTDLAPPLTCRTRRLALGELIAGTLILYPRYLDPETQLPCPPEILFERFARQRRPRRSFLIAMRQLQGRIAKLFGTVTD